MSIKNKSIRINDKIVIGQDHPLFLIAGPCVIENRDHAMFMAKEIQSICSDLDMPFIFKASYDKANRSSIHSYRGPGLEKGLDILRQIKENLDIPVLSDVHEPGHLHLAARVLDIIQIPALLCRQTDLILETARSKKPVNIKKGQFLSPYEVKNIIDKFLSQDNDNIMLTERGTFFGYNNLVVDIRSIPIMRKWGYPVVIDASHSVQRPGGEGDSSGGDFEFIPYIARAGVSAYADGVFLEVHDTPAQSRSDRHNSFNLNKLHDLLSSLLSIQKALARHPQMH